MKNKLDFDAEMAKKVIGKPYARRLSPDETGGYVGSILEFPGCFAEGDSAEEAMKNLNEAAESWVESALSSGCDIREPISFEGCSGKIALRVPRGLHKQIAELAELEDTSINQLLVTAISTYVGSKRSYEIAASNIIDELKRVFQESLTNFYKRSPLPFIVALPVGGNYQSGSTTTPHLNFAAKEMIALSSG